MRLTPQVITGYLFLLAAVLAGAIWYIYLFVAVPPHISLSQSAIDLLRYTFSAENPQRLWFAWMGGSYPKGLVHLAIRLSFASARIVCPQRLGARRVRCFAHFVGLS